MFKEELKKRLTKGQLSGLRAASSVLTEAIHTPRVFINRHFRLRSFLAQERVNVHLGCSSVHLDDYINIDLRPTAATDLAFDCTTLAPLPENCVDRIVSNAFFEHLFMEDRSSLLRDAYRVLKPGGLVLFTGLPDFAGVAKAYLEQRKPGNISPTFDLHEAYRYTHGAPEGTPGWWLPQLHKGLLDKSELCSLLKEAGFRDYCVFSYCYGEEPHRVTLGFVACKGQEARAWTAESLQALDFPRYARINWDSMMIEATSN